MEMFFRRMAMCFFRRKRDGDVTMFFRRLAMCFRRMAMLFRRTAMFGSYKGRASSAACRCSSPAVHGEVSSSAAWPYIFFCRRAMCLLPLHMEM
jgi:hypothetical protein